MALDGEITSSLELGDATDELLFALQAVLPPPEPFRNEQRNPTIRDHPLQIPRGEGLLAGLESSLHSQERD